MRAILRRGKVSSSRCQLSYWEDLNYIERLRDETIWTKICHINIPVQCRRATCDRNYTRIKGVLKSKTVKSDFSSCQRIGFD